MFTFLLIRLSSGSTSSSSVGGSSSSRRCRFIFISTFTFLPRVISLFLLIVHSSTPTFFHPIFNQCLKFLMQHPNKGVPHRRWGITLRIRCRRSSPRSQIRCTRERYRISILIYNNPFPFSLASPLLLIFFLRNSRRRRIDIITSSNFIKVIRTRQ